MSTITMNPPHADARFWNLIAARYARKAVPDQAAYETKLRKTNGYLNITDRVLEIGCGTGSTALHHASRVASVLGTDISPRMIDIAREKARAAGADNVAFEVSSVEDLESAPTPYDVIMAHSILHLVEDVPATLQRLYGLLKPGGLLISNTQCIGDSARWLGWVAPMGRHLGVLPRVNVFQEATFFAWIEDAGFAVEEVWQTKPKASHYVVARTV